ncbi:MAG: hypothetical protein C0623_00325 [Desulfuromonas sp.]|nr:MAG: hypothetical protein C0623_00325 [Desulfuromonas sp.]
MADQDDFTFDEQDSDSEEWYEEEEPKKKGRGGSRSRLLVLLLLLVAIAGGAYYYLMMPVDDGPAAPSKEVVKLKKKAVSLPPKPIKQPAAIPVKKPAKAESAAEPAPAEVAVKEPVKSEKKPVAKPVETAQQDVPSKDQAKEEPAKVPPAHEKVFQKPDMPKPKVASVGGAYSLTAGTFLLESSVRSVSKKIRALGYEPELTPVKRKVKMTRLKLGTFTESMAASKMAEVRRHASDVFSIRKGNMETVYVGSYLVLDQARRFADKLYRNGITVTEEPVEVTKTLQRVTFGSFANADEATAAARQVATRGVEAQLYKNR